MAADKSPQQSAYLISSGWVAIIFNSIAIFSLVHNAFDFGLTATFAMVLDHYDNVLRIVFWPLELVFRWIADLISLRFSIDIELHEHWRNPLLIVGLYFFTDIRVSYIGRGLPRAMTWSTIATALIVAPLAGIVSGLFPLDGTYNLAILAPIAAFVIFEVIKSPVNATFYRSADQTWLDVFLYYLVFYAVANAVLGLTAFFALKFLFYFDAEKLGALTFVVFLGLLVLRNIIMAAVRPLFLRSPEPWLKRFLGSGSLRTAANVIYMLTLFGFYLIINL